MISIVQTTAKAREDATSGGTPSLQFDIEDVLEGSTIIVPVFAYASPSVSLSFQYCEDSAGRYSRDAYIRTSDGTAGVFINRLSNVSAGTHSLTIRTASINTRVVACAIEVASDRTRGGIIVKDSDRYNRSTGTAVTTGSTTMTRGGNALLVGACCVTTGQASIAVDTGTHAYLEQIEELDFTTYLPGEVDACVVSGQVSASYAATLASSGLWAACLVTYTETLS